MKKNNKKGFGLIMAVVIVTTLLIMSLGFFQLTDYSTKSTHQHLDNMRLYWAVESASNYNVNWWVNQEDGVRIDWPSTYTAPTGTYSTSSKNTYDDINQYEVSEENFPYGKDITDDGSLYLHASSVIEHPKHVIDGFEIITVRYKGQRKDEPDKAVWVLDSYAYDTSSGLLANITLTNVFNQNFFTNLDLLANNEVMNLSQYESGFNGALSAFSKKDVRFGMAYYASIIRLDLQTGSNPVGPLFFSNTTAGPVMSAALQSGSPYAQSRWGNAAIENMTDFLDTENYYGYGLAARGQITAGGGGKGGGQTEQQIVEGVFRRSFDNGATPYFKDVVPYSLEHITWTWDEVESDGTSYGIYMLDPTSGSGDVTVTLDVNSGTTTAVINSSHGVKTIQIGKGEGVYSGIAVPKRYGQVNISGKSNKSFTLITQESPVKLTSSFYASELENTRQWIQNNASFISQENTTHADMQKIWADMNINSVPETKLGIIAQLGVSDGNAGKPIIFSTASDYLFSTAAIVAQNGGIEAESHNGNTAFVNIGSIITLNQQAKEQGGTAAHKYTKALIQDQRYLLPNFGNPDFFGPGPQIIEQHAVLGLNRQHRWTKSTVTKTNDWNEVVWKRGGWKNPQF